MPIFAKPENALKRTEELVNVGQNQAALQAPALVISSPFSPSPQLLPTTPSSQSQKLQLGLDNGKIRACPSVTAYLVKEVSAGGDSGLATKKNINPAHISEDSSRMKNDVGVLEERDP